MYATAQEMGAHLLLISEQPRFPTNGPIQITCPDNNCGILITRGADFTIEQRGSGTGFCWMQTGNIKVFSCYLSPNLPLRDFIDQLFDIEHAVRLTPLDVGVILAGDFNSKSPEWGSQTEDERGRVLAETVISLGMKFENVGTRATFQRGNSESVIDVTFSRLQRLQILHDWRVLEDFSHSDHKYVTYQLALEAPHNDPDVSNNPTTTQCTRPGWAYRKLDVDRLNSFFTERSAPQYGPDTTAETAARHVSEFN